MTVSVGKNSLTKGVSTPATSFTCRGPSLRRSTITSKLRRLNSAITCYSMNRPLLSPAGDLGQEAMALLSLFGPNLVPKVRDKPQPAGREVEV